MQVCVRDKWRRTSLNLKVEKLEISENRVKEILGGVDQRLKEIHERILRLYEEEADNDSLIRSISIRKIEWDKQASGKGGKKRDLSDVMLMHYKLMEERDIALKAEMYNLAKEEEQINRIGVCFRSLRGEEYFYLQELYVNKKPYKTVEAESGVSHKTFEMTRKRAMRKLLKTYQSELSNIDIIKKSAEDPEAGIQIRKQNTEETGNYEQLTFKL